MLPQEVEVITNKEKGEKTEREWAQKIERWRDSLGTDKDALARQSIRSIEDPNAVKALVNALKRSESPFKTRLLLVEALSRINTSDAVKALAVQSMEDRNEEVRLTCLDYLKKVKDPQVVSYYVSQLKSKDNVLVNRAAVGLSNMRDLSAVGPLIDALITTHKFKIVTGSGSPNSINTTFNTGGNGAGGGGMSMGGGPKIIKKEIRNQAVLDALVMLTGVNFNFDVRAWKSWFANQKQRDQIDARRN
jgi:hypothetical protein